MATAKTIFDEILSMRDNGGNENAGGGRKESWTPLNPLLTERAPAASNDIWSQFDPGVMEAVGGKYKSQWGDKYYYDVFDADDYQRMQSGKMPKYLEEKYDLADPVDQYLYDNGLPWRKSFIDMYSEAAKDYADEQVKAEKAAARTIVSAADAKEDEDAPTSVKTSEPVASPELQLPSMKLDPTISAMLGVGMLDPGMGVVAKAKTAEDKQEDPSARAGYTRRGGYRFTPDETKTLQSGRGYEKYGDKWLRWNDLAQRTDWSAAEKKEAQAAVREMKKYTGGFEATRLSKDYDPAADKEIRDLQVKLDTNANGGFSAGFMQALGLDWLADRAGELGETVTGVENPAKGENSFQARMKESASMNPLASTLGGIGGNLMLVFGAGAGAKAATGSIKGFSALPKILQSAATKALIFGATGAYRGLTDTVTEREWNDLQEQQALEAAAQGVDFEPQEYNAWGQVLDVLTAAGRGTLGGAVGGTVGGLLEKAGVSVLLKDPKLQTAFADWATRTISSFGEGASHVGVQYLTYPKGTKPTKEQIAQDLAVTFLFSMTTSAIESGKATTAAKYNTNVKVQQAAAAYQQYMRDYAYLTPEDQAAALQRCKDCTQQVRADVQGTYYAGQGKWVQETLKAIDELDDLLTNKMIVLDPNTVVVDPAQPIAGAMPAGAEVPQSGLAPVQTASEAPTPETGLAPVAGSVLAPEAEPAIAPTAEGEAGLATTAAAVDAGLPETMDVPSGVDATTGEILPAQPPVERQLAEPEEVRQALDVLRSAQLPEETVQAISTRVKALAAQSVGAVAPEAQQALTKFLSVAQQAGRKISVYTAEAKAVDLRAAQTVAKANTAAQNAVAAARQLLDAGDMVGWTKAKTVEANALQAYQDAVATRQADAEVQRAKLEERLAPLQEQLVTAAAEIENAVNTEVASRSVAKDVDGAYQAAQIAQSQNPLGNTNPGQENALQTENKANQREYTGLQTTGEHDIINVNGGMQNDSGTVLHADRSGRGRVGDYAGGQPRLGENGARGALRAPELRRGEPGLGQGSDGREFGSPSGNGQSVGRSGNRSDRGIGGRAVRVEPAQEARSGEVGTGTEVFGSPRKTVTRGVYDWRLGDTDTLTSTLEQWNRKLPVPIDPDTVYPVTEPSPLAIEIFGKLRSLLGRDFFLYGSDSDEAPGGFVQKGQAYVAQSDDPIMAFHAGHEWMHLDPVRLRVMLDVFDNLPKATQDSLYEARRLRLSADRGEDFRDETSLSALKEEIVCDMAGEFVHSLVSPHPLLNDLGIPEEVYEEFERALAGTFEAGMLEDMGADDDTPLAYHNNTNGLKFSPRTGMTEDGVSIFRSVFPANMDKADKQAYVISLIQNLWSKNPIQIMLREPGKSPREITAQFDPTVLPDERTDATKLAGGTRHGRAADQRISLNLVPDIYEIVKETKHVRSEPAHYKPGYAHEGVKEYHYLLGDIVYERDINGVTVQEPCTVLIDIKDKGDEQYFYEFSVERKKLQEPQLEVQSSGIPAVQAAEAAGGTPRGIQSASASDEAVLMPPTGIILGGPEENNPENAKFSSQKLVEPMYSSQKLQEPGDDAPKKRSKAQKNLEHAQALFEAGTSPVEYAQSAGRKYDHAVAKVLRRMYLDNGTPVGGALATPVLNDILSTSKNWKQPARAALSLSFPVRVFEDLGAWRSGELPSDVAMNYREGERLKDVYWYYGLKQGADMDLWQRSERAKVEEAFGKSNAYVSTLAQLMGEKYLTKDAAKRAVADANTMIVPVSGGVLVFDKHGQLKLMADGEHIAVFDDSYRARMREANKQIAQIVASDDPKMGEAEKQAAIRQAIVRAKGVQPITRQSTIRIVRDGDSVAVVDGSSGATLERVVNGKTPDVDAAAGTASAIADFYQRALPTINRALIENGQQPIGEITDYFPHQGRTDLGLNQFIATLRGDAETLPTEISGLTPMFEPGKPWFSNLLERMGTYTEFDAIRGFNKYLQGAGDVIFFTPVIQRLRQLERALRAESEGSTNTAMVGWLRSYANQMANKKADLDRAFEDIGGRAVYTVSDKLTRLFGAASVAGNVSTALSNFISALSAVPGLDARYIPGAVVRTLWNNLRKTNDGLADRIPFLVRRFEGYESILTTRADRAKRAGGKLLGAFFQAVDRFATESVARAKYEEYKRQGLSDAEAAKRTSAFCNKIFADRAKGMTASFFTSKFFKPFVQFQLEVTNQMSHFRDINRQGVGERYDKTLSKHDGDFNAVDWADAENRLRAAGVKDWGRYAMYLLLMSAWGLFTRWAMGRDQTWNPFGMAQDFSRDLKNDGIMDAMVGLGGNALEQLPGSSLFLDGGRVPALGGVENVWTAVKDIATGEETAGDSIIRAVASFMPGGAQLRKTVTGVQMIGKGGSYTGSGALRYPVDEEDYWKALVFGPSAAAPSGYNWGEDQLSKSKTENYQALVDAGVDSKKAYAVTKNYNAATNATKALSILTTDADHDGKKDFGRDEQDLIAQVLGLSYDPEKDGSLETWAMAESDDYLNKKAGKTELSDTEKKKVQAIEDFWDVFMKLK